MPDLQLCSQHIYCCLHFVSNLQVKSIYERDPLFTDFVSSLPGSTNVYSAASLTGLKDQFQGMVQVRSQDEPDVLNSCAPGPVGAQAVGGPERQARHGAAGFRLVQLPRAELPRRQRGDALRCTGYCVPCGRCSARSTPPPGSRPTRRFTPSPGSMSTTPAHADTTINFYVCFRNQIKCLYYLRPSSIIFFWLTEQSVWNILGGDISGLGSLILSAFVQSCRILSVVR